MNTELNTHAGVLEFIAEEGCVNLPQWVRFRPRSGAVGLSTTRMLTERFTSDNR